MNHICKINGLNPATGTGNDKMAKIIDLCHRHHCSNVNLQLLSCSTGVEQLSHNPNINGLNPVTNTGSEKMAKSISLCPRYLCIDLYLVLPLVAQKLNPDAGNGCEEMAKKYLIVP